MFARHMQHDVAIDMSISGAAPGGSAHGERSVPAWCERHFPFAAAIVATGWVGWRTTWRKLR